MPLTIYLSLKAFALIILCFTKLDKNVSLSCSKLPANGVFGILASLLDFWKKSLYNFPNFNFSQKSRVL